MDIVVYVDESRQVEAGDKAGQYIFGGFMGTKKYWLEFERDWQSVLDKYRAPYFHFRELNRAGRLKKESPFFGWSDELTDDFIYDLAFVAGKSAVPIGSCADIAPKNHPMFRADKWKHALDVLLGHFVQQMNLHWPDIESEVRFVFDSQGDPQVLSQMSDAHTERREKDQRIGVIEFSDMKRVLPLQAADMYAYTIGQSGMRAFTEKKRQHNRIIDVILNRNAYPSGHVNHPTIFDNERNFKEMIRQFRIHKKEWESDWRSKGKRPPTYFPEKYFPKSCKNILKGYFDAPIL